jgi:hypothetical protein
MRRLGLLRVVIQVTAGFFAKESSQGCKPSEKYSAENVAESAKGEPGLTVSILFSWRKKTAG